MSFSFVSRVIALAAATFILLAAPAPAQEICHSAGRYAVLEIENADSVGTRFAVRIAPGAAKQLCDFDEAGADYVVGNENDPLWYAGITPRYLVMTRSTGPQGDVVIYDLDERKIRLDVPADEVEVDADAAIYWERVAEGTVANCPEYGEYQSNGLGAAIAAETRFDFAGGEAEATGRTRCDATQ